MKSIPYFLAFVLFLFLQPVRAQDGDGDEDDPEIEIGEGDGGGDLTEEDEDELEKIRKKNSGLAGGGRQDDGDDFAPKVKASLQEQINKAIKAGVKWLKKKQAPDGSYPPVTASRDYKTKKDIGKRYRDELAPSAWAIYALAKCGVKKSDPVLKKGMQYIFDETQYVWDTSGKGKGQFGGHSQRQQPSRANPRTLTTYEAAAIVMMIEAVFEQSAKLTRKHKKRRLHTDNPRKLPSRSKIPKKIWRYMHDRCVYLTVGRRGRPGSKGRTGSPTIPGAQVKQGGNKGGWRYGPGKGGDADLSATQFVLLALRAASQAGYPFDRVARNVWIDAANYVRKCQKSGGGFTYQITGGNVTGSMTACGVGCLVICKEQLELALEYDPEAPRVPSWMDGAIRNGMQWLDQNFSPANNPGGGHHYYYLYGVERVGDLTGRSEFNQLNWYVRGARFLLKHQDPDGKWLDATEAFPPRDVNSTSLALLFLKRATPPVVTISDRDR